MSDLINREVAVLTMRNMANPDEAAEFEAILRNVPAVDAEPVRRGRWKYIVEIQRTASVPITCRLVCSQCHINKIRHIGEIFNYCPNCGAKME